MYSHTVSQRLPFTIGRQREKNQITQSFQTRSIILIEGDAGIGKSILLEETGRIAQEQGILCLPVMDFYDAAMHSHQGLEATIARSLDPDGEAFGEYWAQRENDPQAELWEPFQAGYKAALGDRRAVLRFDTAERLEYERDSQEVIDDCGVTELDAPSWEWLLKRIGDLPNTTILIAARPTPTGLLRQRLLEAHGDRVLVLEVTGFALEETDAYFRATEFGWQVADESPEMVEKIHLLADGRPILIALALDWLKRGMWDPRLYPVSVAELRAWKAQTQAEEEADQRGEARRQWHETRQRFEAALVEQNRRLASPLDIAVRYVALCRKGCNAALLSRLMDIDEGKAAKLIEELLMLSFVKPPRPGSHGLFFLHDEMYDLVEKYVWLVDWPDYSEQARLDRVIIDWYTEQIEVLKMPLKNCQDRGERADLRSLQQLLIAEHLYYQFDADPRIGYREYSHWDEEAIGSRELAWDAWLRNEALWFTSHRAWRRGAGEAVVGGEYPLKDPAWLKNGQVVRSPAVDYDCRRRRVNRYIARNEMAKAARVAEKLLTKSPTPEEPELYRAGVQIALATAQAYMGGELTAAALRNFDKGTRALKKVPDKHHEPWLYPHLLGTASLYKGLALRGLMRLKEAAHAYGRASQFYHAIGYSSGQAEALNNLAYIYVRQGRLDQALSSCNKALHIREELGDEYSIGLSLNTQGIIYERLDRPLTAINDSEQALAIFQEIGNERGVILAQINLGRSYRRKARSPEWGYRDEDFEAGTGYLQNAINLQAKQGTNTDMFYRIEAHNELGCLYRDWVATLYEQGKIDNQICALLDEAERHLHQAVELTKEETKAQHVVQHIDSLEDLARVHYWRARLNSPCQEGEPPAVMRSLLEQAERLATTHLKGQDELKLILGKIHFQYARLARETRQNANQVAGRYALAAGYAESYSLDAPELRKFVQDASDWLREMKDKEAEVCVQVMRTKLKDAGLPSIRLRDEIESVVRPLLGVGWSGEAPEVVHG